MGLGFVMILATAKLGLSPDRGLFRLSRKSGSTEDAPLMGFFSAKEAKPTHLNGLVQGYYYVCGGRIIRATRQAA